MNSSCEALKQNKIQNGEKLLEEFLSALDGLLQNNDQLDNKKASAVFSIVESMLKLIGLMLPSSQTKRSTTRSDVELLVKRNSTPPGGRFMVSSNGTWFTSHWDTATGKEYMDTNECVNTSINCGGNAECVNSQGGYACKCKSGYVSSSGKETFTVGQGVQCVEFNYEIFKKKITAFEAANPELAELVFLMNSSCEALKQNKIQNGEKLLEEFLSALDGLLQNNDQLDNKKASAVFSIVESMLKLIGLMLPSSQTKRSTTRSDVELLVKRNSTPPGGRFMVSSNGTWFTSHWDTATGKEYMGFSTVALLSYTGLEESLSRYFNHLEKQEKQTFKINSEIVTATVSNEDTANLEKPVNFTFSHLKKENVNHICVFWDHDLDGGAWSTRNCSTVRSTADETICSCSHLSSFAVLMALYDIGDVYELRLISWVGLSLSLVCLLICIITFYAVRSIQSTRNTIHMHLCISLFIAYFVFLVGITRTENKVGCSVVAGVLHYFFLASFCWMCLEGVQLFRMVVLVFNTTLRHVYMFAAGYGVPALIVAISASVNASGYGTPNYCWLNIDDGFIWSFYGPVCIIIVVNVFFFLITIWKLAEKFSSLNPDLDNLRKIKAFTVTAIAQLCVLGIMWVFGCFQFDSTSLAMSYIFTILGSLQGVLMFIMHCWLSKQVRDEYAKFLSCICAPQKRKYSEFSSNQTSKSQASKSVQHTGESQI
ncbi:adhesion G protein-coupled receptor E5 isoform X1 [Danio rerio]|uniref:Adhesion G protein-coupled receptor E5 isoform X1 n=5 Tax=Danio rerio TaxID=7955 RepID=A0AC58J3R6_DANRE